MVTRQQVLQQVRQGASYEVIGRSLGIPPGQAYLIATGIPADGSDSLSPEDQKREGLRLGGTQSLLGVPHHNPNEPGDKPQVMEWVKRRAAVELTPAPE